MNDLQVLERLESLTGLTTQGAMRRAVNMAARGLGAKISGELVHQLARGMPPVLATSLQVGVSEPPLELDGLYARVSEASGLRFGVALELTQTTFAVIAELGNPEAVERARASLPDEWSALLQPPSPTRTQDRPPPPAELDPGTGHTLATGRPGSRHPVSGSEPSRGQRDSIATSDDPHSDTKLSATRGISSERKGESLAEGRPGSLDHPLSESTD